MKKKTFMTRAAALLLCAATAISMIAAGMAGYALGEEREASITFRVGDSMIGDHKDLMDYMAANPGSKLEAALYQVAGFGADGRYALTGDFAQARGLEGIPGVDKDTKAGDWEAYATAAKNALRGTDIQGTRFAMSGSDLRAGHKVGGLAPGLYLLDIKEFKAGDHAYAFTPYLIAAPGYNADGTRNYDVEAGLKPERVDLYGKLVIRKNLPECRQDGDGSTFVFEVIARRDGETVFDDIYSMVFSEHGTKELVIENLPADAEITVKELYSGSCYHAEVTEQDTRVPAEGTATVEFRNIYDPDAPRNGASAVNKFTIGEDGKLAWTKLDESPAVNNKK